MNILMFTNTFLPHVGGVARSILHFSQELQRSGHQVKIVAPVYNGEAIHEEDILRVHAIRDFNGSGFSLPLPAPNRVAALIKSFRPHIMHTHHPFLLGNAALRWAAYLDLPLVFTYHTLYEHYTHYIPFIPADSPRVKQFVTQLTWAFCDLCDTVIAPSPSVASLLTAHGVKTRIEVVPTGVDPQYFSGMAVTSLRTVYGIAEGAFVVGHVGRLAPEKNLRFLSVALCRFLRKHDQALALIVGRGPMEDEIRRMFKRHGLSHRLFMTGTLEGVALGSAYKTMDVFAFTSLSETQGIVLIEAMAAGLPIVALDAPGVRDVVIDGIHGRLVTHGDLAGFEKALMWVATLEDHGRRRLAANVARAAAEFAPRCGTSRLLDIYTELTETRRIEGAPFKAALGALKRQAAIAENYLASAARAGDR